VLGWIGTTNRHGVLTVRGVGSETMLHLRQGRIVECAAANPPVLLGQFLLFHGVIDEEVLDQAMRAHAAQGQRLGDVLLEMGAVSSEDMQVALTAKAEETVLGSFDHVTGWFTFDPKLTDLEAPMPLDMSITDAITRGQTRVESAAVAAAIIKRSGSVLRKTSKAPSAKLSSVWPLRTAYALVDGERSVDEIVLHMHGTEFHVIQRLHQLYLEGFIEVLEESEETPSSRPEPASDAIVISEVTESSIRMDPRRTEASVALEGIVPRALPPEFVKDTQDLSNVEKYLLTLCDGKRDLRRIAAVAPLQSQVVVDTIQSLKDRGWLKASSPASNC
jgi:uncharacterized protein DUF4388